ncbi:branched-chain amino acid ABC transporter substrate-binding protein [Aminobacter sp. BE322]|uniref:branched-chain amino acid ABC transporter substrate-binding protein n=1 Tax=unclassified Aminobacter TaxID=2644704 RepID=UPI003D1E575D
MRPAAGIITACAASLLALAAKAEPARIGVAAPLSGAPGILGGQVRSGAVIAAESLGVALDVIDDRCTADGGTAAAQRFVEAKVTIAVGFLCSEALEAALPALKQAGIPVITVGVRTDGLTDRREKTGWPVYRLGPRGDGERDTAAAILTKMWRNELFAVVDDGTIYGRELAESFRVAAEQSGLKPVFVDTFRPQLDNQLALVGRLRKAGATHVFVGGDGEDIAVMARDAAVLGTDMVFAGGETLRLADRAVPPAEGTLMIAPAEWTSMAAPAVISAFEARKATTDGYALPAYAAVEIANAAATSGKPPAEALDGGDFDTALGNIRFDAKGDLAANPYRLFRFDGTNYVPLETQ